MNLSLSQSFRYLLLLLLFCTSMYSSSTLSLTQEHRDWIEQNPKVIVANELEWSPYNFKDKNRTDSGVIVDILSLMSEDTGLEFVNRSAVWSDVLESAKNSQVDMIGGLYYSKERSKYLNFSRPYANTYEYFFARSDLNMEKFSDLNGKIVAIPRGYQVVNELKSRFPDVDILEVNSTLDAINAVLQYRADLLVNSYVTLKFTLQKFGIYNIIPFKPLKSYKLYMATTKQNNTLLEIVNKALANIDQKRIDKLISKYADNTLVKRLDISLTNEEREWIKANNTITLGADFKWVPFEFDDDRGEHSGISSDIIEIVRTRTGLNIEIVSGVWANILHLAKSGEIDGLACAISTKDRLEYLSFTVPYASVSTAIVMRDNANPIYSLHDLYNRRVSVNKDSYMHEWIKSNYPSIEVVEARSNEEALEFVSFGKADAYIGNVAVATYVIKNSLLSNLKIKLKLNEIKTEPSIAINKENKILTSIISKAVKSINEPEKREILSRWYSYSQSSNIGLDDNQKKRYMFDNQGEVVTFAGDSDWLPFEAFDNNFNHIGMVASYLSEIEKDLDISFSIKKTDNWSETLQMAQRGEVDVISADRGDSSILEKYRPVTPYITTPIVIVKDQNSKFISDLDNLKSETIVTIAGHGYNIDLYREYASHRFIEVEDASTALSYLRDGSADIALMPLPRALFVLEEEGFNEFKIVGKTSIQMSATLFVSRDRPRLYALIDMVMKNISQKKKFEISSEWMDVSFAKKTDYTLLIWLSVIFLLLIAVSLYWTRKLAREIERKNSAQRALQREKDNFQVLFNSTPDGSLIIQSGKFIECNSAALKILGLLDKSELMQQDPISWSVPIQPDGKEASKQIPLKLKEALTKGSCRFEWQNQSATGHKVWVDVVLTRIVYNKKIAFYVVWRDISEQKALQENLEVAKNIAIAANSAKSNFLANMSHDIRTPMNAIVGFSDLLDEQIKDPRLRSYIKTIRSASDTLLALIDDILDLSKIEAGKLNIQSDDTDISILIEDVVGLFILSAADKSIELIVDIDKSVPRFVKTDQIRLKQILFNLISNAIKFTHKGYVKITLKVTKTDSNKLDLTIEVEDSGIGIPGDQIENIFGAFEQVQGQDNREYSGTGLGLAISSRLSELLGGTLRAKSVKGKGSTFILHLKDIEVTDKINLGSITSKSLDPKNIVFKHSKILLVDDIAFNLEVLEQIFYNTNIEVASASSGQKALDLIHKEEFDLILMDIRMPKMDGYETSRAAREICNTPIVALSASTEHSERKSIEDNGLFDRFIQKPFRKKDLFLTLIDFLPYDVVESEHKKSEVFELSTKAKENLDTILKIVSLKLDPSYKSALSTNSLSDIEKFADEMELVADEFDIEYFKKYAQSLKEAVDVFDITLIQSLLYDFRLIREKLLSF